jgi:hypothetical protein
MRPPRAIAMTLAAAVLTACTSGGPAKRSASEPRRDPDLITAEELATATAGTLYDAVQALRPAWMLRSRPTAVLQQQQAQLIVYLDGTRYGNLESLRQITPGGIVSVRYHSPGSAEARFGPGHLLGAIEVRTLSR